MSYDIKTIQDVRDLLSKNYLGSDDALQYFWGIHRDGKNGRKSTLEICCGREYAQSTPAQIDERNLELAFEEFSTDELIKVFRGITDRRKPPASIAAPVVIVKFGDNYHGIDGARRIRHWYLNDDDGPHKACILIIKEGT